MTQKTFSVTGSRTRKLTIPALILLTVISPLISQDGPQTQPVLLGFIHTEGEVLHADALVNESVYISGIYSHDAQISESSLTRTLQVFEDGSADLLSEFRTDEWIVGSPGYREWISTETVNLQRETGGRLTVPLSAARPVLRDIPVFPETPVSPGDTWTAEAEEVHVFRIGGALWGPYRGSLLASYEYEGSEWREDVHLARIRIEYDMYIPVRGPGEPVRLISGRSSQLLFWNIDAGVPWNKSEEFEFLMMMSDGRTQEFTGRQDVTYRQVQQLDRNAVADSLRNGPAALTGISVDPTDEGILLTIDDVNSVLFDPESAVISPGQVQRLEILAEALSDFPDRDLLISGHTAHYGSEEGRKALSLQRAAAVADILFPDGREGVGKLYLRGMGSDEPVGIDAENRRVEILILD